MAEEAPSNFDIRDVPRRPLGGGPPRATPQDAAAAGGGFNPRNLLPQQMNCGQHTVKIVGGCVGCSTLIVIIAVIMSLGSVAPTEYGLKYNKFTKHVDTSGQVYRAGRHLIGPVSALIKFPATAQSLEFSDRKGATAEPLSTRTQEGLALTLHVSFQYHLIKDEISDLYALANVRYESLYIKVARDILLKAAAKYTAPQYWQERQAIGNEMFQLVNAALKPSHADTLGLQLLVIGLPQNYEDSIVATQVQKQTVKTTENEQKAAVIRAKIGAMVAYYQNNITVTLSEAEANARYTTKSAEAQAAKLSIEAENTAIEYTQKSMPNLSHWAQVSYQEMYAYQIIKNASFLFGVKNAVTVLGANQQPGSAVPPSPPPPPPPTGCSSAFAAAVPSALPSVFAAEAASV